MDIAMLLVAIAVTVLTVTALAGRFGFPAPILLILVGWAASYVPWVPDVHLEPEIVLLGFLPPLLYAASLQTSLIDFNANRRPILLLSVWLVVVTTVGVALVVHWLIPSVGWPAAFAIGAVVAPPDAIAATAIGRRVGMPRRVVTILEGESLLNDATALVGLRTAIGAAAVGIQAVDVGRDFVVAAGGGVAVGFVVFFVVAKIRQHLTDPLLDTGVSLAIPFVAYIAAEEINASGVIAVVVCGVLLGHKAPILQTAQARIAEQMNWRTIAFVLENTVFLLIGLQAQWLIDDVRGSTLSARMIVAVCLATLATVILLRIVWVFLSRYLLIRPTPDPETGMLPDWRYSFLLAWAGMRGVVTLAAAFVIPDDVAHREVLLMVAFTVVAGTLLGQGLTLGWVARRLGVPSPDPVDDALARATVLQQAAKAGFKRLDQLEYDDPYDVKSMIKQRVEQRTFAAWERLGTTSDDEAPSDLYSRLRGEMIDAERRRVLEIRSAGHVPSEVVREVLARLDVEESMLEAAESRVAELRPAIARRTAASCEHLASTPLIDPPDDLVCPSCVEADVRWVALRMCLSCGSVGCCDSSPLRHATAHFRESGHAVMRSIEPGEDWRWCFMHHVTG